MLIIPCFLTAYNLTFLFDFPSSLLHCLRTGWACHYLAKTRPKGSGEEVWSIHLYRGGHIVVSNFGWTHRTQIWFMKEIQLDKFLFISKNLQRPVNYSNDMNMFDDISYWYCVYDPCVLHTMKPKKKRTFRWYIWHVAMCLLNLWSMIHQDNQK